MGSAWRVGETHFNRLPHPPGFARQLRTYGGRRVCEEIPVSISTTFRRAALLRGLSAPGGALALCRNALERCYAALRPGRSAALLDVLVRAGCLKTRRARSACIRCNDAEHASLFVDRCALCDLCGEGP